MNSNDPEGEEDIQDSDHEMEDNSAEQEVLQPRTKSYKEAIVGLEDSTLFTAERKHPRSYEPRLNDRFYLQMQK